MSLVNKTGRRINSPENIKIPYKFNADFETMVFFRELKQNLFEVFKILKGAGSIKEVSSDYETLGTELILVSETLTITLRDNPEDQEVVTIKNIGGVTTINGNSKKIDGNNYLYITNKYDSPKLIYLSKFDEWFIV